MLHIKCEVFFVWLKVGRKLGGAKKIKAKKRKIEDNKGDFKHVCSPLLSDSDSVIREFKSLHPSHLRTIFYNFVGKTIENSAFFVFFRSNFFLYFQKVGRKVGRNLL